MYSLNIVCLYCVFRFKFKYNCITTIPQSQAQSADHAHANNFHLRVLAFGTPHLFASSSCSASACYHAVPPPGHYHTTALNSSIISCARNLRLCSCPPSAHCPSLTGRIPYDFTTKNVIRFYASGIFLGIDGLWADGIVDVADSYSDTLQDQQNLQTVGELESVMGNLEYYSAQTKCLE